MEIEILKAVQDIQNPVVTFIMKIITYSGDMGIIMIAACIGLIIFKKTRKCGVAALITLVINFVFANIILKNIFARPRPWTVYDFDLLIKKPAEFSFPSGHTVNSFAVATAVFMYYKKPGIYALIYSVLIGISRIYFCVHYPTDVLFGAIIGVLDAIVICTVVKRFQLKKDLESLGVK